MSWTLRKGQKDWEIWQDHEKYDERFLPFLRNGTIPCSFATLEELDAWITREEKKIAKNSVIRLLARRNYPSQILKRKLLLKGFCEKISDEMVFWAINQGYVQDGEYLRSAIRKEMMRGYGSKAISWKLQSKEFPKEAIAKELMAIMPMNVEIELAQKELSKMHVGSDIIPRRKAVAALFRRGFSMDVIRKLKFGASGKTGKWDDISDVFHSSDE